MREVDCTRLARATIQNQYAAGSSTAWSCEFADEDQLRPDGLIVECNGFFRSLFGGPYVLHVIESKVDRRYFTAMSETNYPQALEQVETYYGNAKWLSVAENALYDDEWEVLHAHCREAGVGLVCCQNTRNCMIVCTPKLRGGEFWRAYPGLCDAMQDLGLQP